MFSKASRRALRQARASRLIQPIEVSIKRTVALTATAIAGYTAAALAASTGETIVLET